MDRRHRRLEIKLTHHQDGVRVAGKAHAVISIGVMADLELPVERAAMLLVELRNDIVHQSTPQQTRS